MMQRQSLIEYGTPLSATEAETPTPAGTEVLVRVSHCGVCHSDVHLQDGFFELGGDRQLDIRSGRELPFTLGHEIAGTVEAVGPDADGVAVGERYAVYPWIGCHDCGLCGQGDEHLCNAPRALGITVDGGYASHVLVPEPKYLLSVQDLEPELAGSYMCSGLTAYGALRKAVDRNSRGPVLIVGLGGVGMMGLQFAQALLSCPIYAADIDAAKRQAALDLGATAAFDPAEDGIRRTVVGATKGGAAAVIDFVGSEASINFSQSVAAKAGMVVVVGLMGGSFTMPVPMFPLRMLTITGSYVGSLEEAKDMLALVRSGKVAPIPVDLRPLAEAERSLNDLRSGDVVGRVVLTP